MTHHPQGNHQQEHWLFNRRLIGMIRRLVDAQAVQPIPTTTIEQTKDAVEAFSMGMGVGRKLHVL